MLSKIGFIGLGTVGRHMAVNLAKSNYELTVFDLVPTIVQELTASGAKASSSAYEAAKGRNAWLEKRAPDFSKFRQRP